MTPSGIDPATFRPRTPYYRYYVTEWKTEETWFDSWTGKHAAFFLWLSRRITFHYLYRPRRSFERVEGIALLWFLDLGTRRGWGVSVTPRALFTPGKDPVPIVQEAGWDPGPVWTGAPNKTRPPNRPARCQSLSYPAHVIQTWPAAHTAFYTVGTGSVFFWYEKAGVWS
jgi:hypothetical protein